MVRIFPSEITASDVAAMLAALDSTTPEMYAGQACFIFDVHTISVYVALTDAGYDAAARRDLADAIALLPHLHARVARMFASSVPTDNYEVHDLSFIEVDGDDVYLDYCARNYNATWGLSFSKTCFGFPFRSTPFNPVWRTDTAVALARQMYESRDYGTMPILADAIQDAGCDNEDVLNHCRGSGTHRGACCWVVDLVLSKE